MSKTFEDLLIWQRSHTLCVKLYKAFDKCSIYSLKDQLLRSALSIPSNIAEGFDRKSVKEFNQFLNIAKASCSELRAQLLIARDIECIDISFVEDCINESKEISYLLIGFMKGRESF